MKKCKVCLIEKPKSDFRDRNTCRKCLNEENRRYYEANKERLKQYGREYDLAHKTEKKAYNKQYAKEHKQEIRAQKLEYAKRNADRIIAYRKAYSEKHKEKILKYQSAYRVAHADKWKAAILNSRKAKPWKLRVYSQNRRARERHNGGKLSSGLAEKLFKLQRGKCACCGLPLGKNYHLDHIMPIALGGANEDGNIQLLRQRCNNQKHSKHPVDFMQERGFLL